MKQIEDEELDPKNINVDNKRVAQKRMNKMMQITRLNRTVSALVHKLGFESEKQLLYAASAGEVSGTTYDAYLVAKQELQVVKKALSEIETVPRVANLMYFLAHELKNYDFDLYKELKERAGSKLAKITQAYIDSEKESSI
jgi:hypothetical protein